MKQVMHIMLSGRGLVRRRLYALGRVVAIAFLASVLLAPLTASPALACSGAGTPCFTGTGLPGTCDGSGNCVQNANPDGTCTSDAVYDIQLPAAGTGIISTIINYLKTALQPISQQMFTAIVSDSGFTGAVKAAIILYVTIYGLLFTFGMVQLTVSDFAMRVVKMGIVAMLATGTAWGYFNATFVPFFNDGTDDLINLFGTIVVGGNTLGGNPFDWMDQAIVTTVSTKMLIVLMAAASTGPYGVVIVLILLLATWTFVKAMLNAVWVYLMALVMRTLLFGLAPIFLACILFTRTRHLFDGWLNQVVNSCLQPVFLFAFFAFFVQLIKACLDQVVALTVCWTEWAETMRGTPFSGHYWRFAVWDPNLGIYVPFDGIWDFTGPVGVGGPVNPVGIMLPLTMWILTDLAGRFNHIVVQIAKDISSATTEFRFQGRGFFEGGGTGAGATGADGSAKKEPAKPSPIRPGGGARPGPGGREAPPPRGGSSTASMSFEDVKRRFEQFGDIVGNKPRTGPPK